MAIVSFWSNSKRETGQTLSSVAIATSMSINHNYKVLEIATGFMDKTIENCFWQPNRENALNLIPGMRQSTFNSGVEGLVKIIQSNRTSANIVSDYARVVFRDRLDVLPAPKTDNIEDYNRTTEFYAQLAKIASRDYDLVFIDIDKRMPEKSKQDILMQSDAIVLTLKQGLDSMRDIIELRRSDENFQKNNVILLAGKYDKFSRYNVTNMSRELREKRKMLAVPYNTLFFEAASEGAVADFFIKYRGITDQTDRNFIFMQETKRACDEILFKLQELQMRV